MRYALLAIGSLVAIACHGSRSQGPPVRIVAGNADTVIINSYKPVRLPVQVLDAAGHTLPDSGVRFERRLAGGERRVGRLAPDEPGRCEGFVDI